MEKRKPMPKRTYEADLRLRKLAREASDAASDTELREAAYWIILAHLRRQAQEKPNALDTK